MNNAANTEALTLTEGMKIRLPGRKHPLSVSTVVDLAKYPNVGKYITASYGLTGTRGAGYKLDRRTDGNWFLIGMGSTSKVSWYTDSDIAVVG